MDCPVCKKPMAEKDFGGIKVDLCELGCHGIWFNWLELMKLDEQQEGSGPDLDKELQCEAETPIRQGRINCPQCCMPMHEHFYQANKSVRIDECYGCGAFFLDPGELAKIRQGYMNEQEQDNYADQLIQQMPACANYADNLNRQEHRTKAIHSLTRFFRLSHYI